MVMRTALPLSTQPTTASEAPPQRKKTVVIVFPPLTMPTSPPLGASMIKGFVEYRTSPS